jgi:transcriptional regulator with XRE-family HTH domain
MIQNEREYTMARRRLAALRAQARDQPHAMGAEAGLAEEPDLRTQIGHLQERIADYEALRDGRVAALALPSVLDELPSVLACARIARGWRQGDLASALGTTEQQVQKDERGGYDKASLSRLRRVAAALGLRLTGHAILPQRPDLAPAATASGRLVPRRRTADGLPVPSMRPVRPRQPALRWDLPPLSGTASDPALNTDLRVSVSPC